MHVFPAVLYTCYMLVTMLHMLKGIQQIHILLMQRLVLH